MEASLPTKLAPLEATKLASVGAVGGVCGPVTRWKRVALARTNPSFQTEKISLPV